MRPTTHFHPLTWLAGWVAFVLGVQWLANPLSLGLLLTGVFVLALLAARERTFALLRRARWLFLSLVLLFLFFTPGEFVRGLPSWIGITHEGIERAYDQIARLLVMLASLAVLHERLGSAGLLAGLDALLRPFRFREVTVVRLMLVLEHVERREKRSWREWLSPGDDTQGEDRLEMPVTALRPRDGLLILVWFLAAGTWIVLA